MARAVVISTGRIRRAVILGLLGTAGAAAVTILLGLAGTPAHADDSHDDRGLLGSVISGVDDTLGAVGDAVDSTVSHVAEIIVPAPRPAEPAPAPEPANPAPAPAPQPAQPVPELEPAAPAPAPQPAAPGPAAPAPTPSESSPDAPAPTEAEAPTTEAPARDLLPLPIPSDLGSTLVNDILTPVTSGVVDVLTSVPVVGDVAGGILDVVPVEGVLDRTLDRVGSTIDNVVGTVTETVNDVGGIVGVPPIIEAIPLPELPGITPIPGVIPPSSAGDQGSALPISGEPPRLPSAQPVTDAAASPRAQELAHVTASAFSLRSVASLGVSSIGAHADTRDPLSTAGGAGHTPLPAIPTSSISSLTWGALGAAVIAAGIGAALRAWKRPYVRANTALPGAPVLGVDVSPD